MLIFMYILCAVVICGYTRSCIALGVIFSNSLILEACFFCFTVIQSNVIKTNLCFFAVVAFHSVTADFSNEIVE